MQQLIADKGLRKLRVLGGFELASSTGTSIKLPTRKMSLLLAYLATPAGQAHSREKLAGLFWGDTQDEQARGSLRRALAALRAVLDPGSLEVDAGSVALLPGCLETDADLLARVANAPAEISSIDVAALYRGEFLEGYSLPQDALADWLQFERTRHRSLAQTAFEHAIERLQAQGRLVEAIDHSHRLVTLDPLREQSHRVLMRILEAAGERPKALEQYQRLADLLKRELSVEPSPQSAALAAKLLGRLPAGATAPARVAEPLDTRPPVSGTALRLPGPISIVVLPLASSSEGVEDQFVARGFSDDLITQLSRLPELFVIARQSSDQFPSAPTTVVASAGDLGVRYAVSGTYRRSAARLRVTVQLTDAATSRCVWAERYDGEVAEAFAIQDEIIFQIAGALDANIRSAERERVSRLDGEAFDAWEMAHRGLWHVYRLTKQDFEIAHDWFHRAIALSPQFSVPYGGLAYAAYHGAIWNFSADLSKTLAAGIEHGRRAVALDPRNAFAYSALGSLLMFAGRLQDAFDCQRRAIALNPSLNKGYNGLAQAHMWSGEHKQALPLLEQSIRLSPKDPLLHMILTLITFCHFCLGDFPTAVATARRAVGLEQTNERWSRLALAAALSGAGRDDEAREALAIARRFDPKLSINTLEPFLRFVTGKDRSSIFSALRNAGLQ